MAAVSVTGTGLGSAEGADRGRQEYTVGSDKIVGPRIVASGSVTMDGTETVVGLPKFERDAEDYVVLVSDNDDSPALASGKLAYVDAGANLTLKGTDGHEVSYLVVLKGQSVQMGVTKNRMAGRPY